jgi:phage baseplate assembly protein W
MAGISVKLPLNIDSVDGPYSLHKDLKESVKQNLKMLLLTIPGERVMNPDFGVGLQKVLFDNDTKNLRDKIQDRIRKQVSKYMPFLRVSETILPDLGSAREGQVNSLYISVSYYIEPLSQKDILEISLSAVDVT